MLNPSPISCGHANSAAPATLIVWYCGINSIRLTDTAASASAILSQLYQATSSTAGPAALEAVQAQHTKAWPSIAHYMICVITQGLVSSYCIRISCKQPLANDSSHHPPASCNTSDG